MPQSEKRAPPARPLLAAAVIAAGVAIRALVLRHLKRRGRNETAPRRQPRARARARGRQAAQDVGAVQCGLPQEPGRPVAIWSKHWQALVKAASTAPVVRDQAVWADAACTTELINVQLPCAVDELLLHLFHPASSYMSDFVERLSLQGLRMSQWTSDISSGALPWQREVTYDMPLQSRLGPPLSHNVGMQTLQHFNGNCWLVQVDTATPNVPLGKTFSTKIVFIARQVGVSLTALHVSGELVFKKQGIGMIRSQIASAWKRGTRDTYSVVEQLLREAFPEPVAVGAPAPAKVVQGVAAAPQGVVATADAAPAPGARTKQVVQARHWHPRSVALIVLFCLLALMVQLPFIPASQAAAWQQMLSARLLDLFRAMQSTV